MKSWPHAPSKIVRGPGLYVVTAATYRKQRLFDSPEKLDLLHDTILGLAEGYGWKLQAWAVFPNHYHLVGIAPEEDDPVKSLTKAIHGSCAIELNRMDHTPGRQVWFRSWQTRLTFEKSYLARLSYVMYNPVRHGLVKKPEDYPWCSRRWFEAHGDRSFVNTVLNLDTARVRIIDDF